MSAPEGKRGAVVPQLSQNTMTADEALRCEARDMGRACTLLDSSQLEHDVLVIVYSPAPFRHADEPEHAYEVRVAVYIKGQVKTSSVVSTRWLS